jgi:uncharacterized repeat protein (TIGR03803 family)
VSFTGAVGFAHAEPATAATTESVLYKFNGGSDGANPHAGLISDSKGILYGTTWHGGGTGCGGKGCGTVFRLVPPIPPATKWTEQVLYRFQGGSDGAAPFAGLVLDSKGALYGTTLAGGVSFGLGTVFKLTQPAPGHTQWAEQVLYRFTGTGTDGAGPQAGLVFDSTGALYGTTSGGGGPANCGTVFKLAPPAPGHTQWTETVLYSFAGRGDGCLPLYRPPCLRSQRVALRDHARHHTLNQRLLGDGLPARAASPRKDQMDGGRTLQLQGRQRWRGSLGRPDL